MAARAVAEHQVNASRRPAIAPADLARLAIAAVCWGLGTVLSKAALEDIAALPLLAIQLAVSLVILVLLMRVRRIPLRGEDPALLGRLGILNPGIAYALGLLGLATITASLSVLLWVLEPSFPKHLRDVLSAISEGNETLAVEATRTYYVRVDGALRTLLHESAKPPSGDVADKGRSATAAQEADRTVVPMRRRKAPG